MLMMADDFINDEAQKLLGEVRIKPRIFRKAPQPRNLALLAARIGRRQRGLRLVAADILRDLEPLGEHEHERGVDIVDAFPVAL